MFRRKIKFVKQLDSNDCGVACLSMILAYFGKSVTINQLKEFINLTVDGVTISNLNLQAGKVGLELIPIQIAAEALNEQLALPVIAYWEQNHFLIIEKVSEDFVFIIDPAAGRFKINREEFLEGWLINQSIGSKRADNAKKGIVLLVAPLPEMELINFSRKQEVNRTWLFIKENLLAYKYDNFRIFLSLFAISLLQLMLPFTNVLIVDYGIKHFDVPFIYIIAVYICIFYLLIYANEFIRSWGLTYLSTRINFNLISRFLKKITSLPIKTIYSRRIGDFVQRIYDHKKLEEFFSESIIKSFFSVFSIAAYSCVLFFFSIKVFLIVLLLTIFELFWIFRFLGKIRTIDNRIFSLNSQDQDKMYEILSNLSDIKLNNLEEAKNKDWQFIQRRLFKNYLNKLKLSQVEQSGSKILSTIQLFSVTVISALFVVKGEISVGVMFSIIFIVNQLNVPISNLINFILNAQLISNSLQRISEIHNLEDENADGEEPDNITTSNILLNQLTFCYNDSLPVLKNITVCIPANRTTAIVGYSGSGKTTLLKLLLKFYDDYKGEILLEHKGEKNLKRIRSSYWREQCGAVLQESNIYSDTIAYNITLTGIDSLDYDRLAFAIEMAHLTDLVNTLPLGISTKLNSAGINLSSGQRQRILIARMIYKSPSFVFLDEATNSLDANTEKVIMNNLTDFFQNRTVVIIAHRLSTVKNADQIIVLDKGEIVEIGNHRALVDSRGAYFHLIKNQLELEYGEQ